MDKSKLLKISREEILEMENLQLKIQMNVAKIKELEQKAQKLNDKIMKDYNIGKEDQIKPDGTIIRNEKKPIQDFKK